MAKPKAKTKGHMSPAKKKKIIADYAVHKNYREVARIHGISATHVRRLVDADPEAAQKVAQKTAEAEADILDWLAGRTNKFKALWELAEKRTGELIPDTKDIQRMWTGLGIVADKMTKGAEIDLKRREVAIKESQHAAEMADRETTEAVVSDVRSILVAVRKAADENAD